MRQRKASPQVVPNSMPLVAEEEDRKSKLFEKQMESLTGGDESMSKSMMLNPQSMVSGKMRAAPQTHLLSRAGPKNENIRVYLRMRPVNNAEINEQTN